VLNGAPRLKIKKNQREGNTPPPPIAILLVLRKPKNQFQIIILAFAVQILNIRAFLASHMRLLTVQK
jgi:hypothetical protein